LHSHIDPLTINDGDEREMCETTPRSESAKHAYPGLSSGKRVERSNTATATPKPLVCLRCNIDPLASAALESTRASSVLSQASRQPAARRVARIQITAATQILEGRSTYVRRWIGLCEPGQLDEPSSVTGSDRPAYTVHTAPAQARRRRPGSRLGPGAHIQS
jgi:hypothetical protein